MNDSFSALHPALTFCYFAAVLLLTMTTLYLLTAAKLDAGTTLLDDGAASAADGSQKIPIRIVPALKADRESTAIRRG